MNLALHGYRRITDSLSLLEVVISMIEKENDESTFENSQAIYDLLSSIHANMRNASKNIMDGLDEAGLWEGS